MKVDFLLQIIVLEQLSTMKVEDSISKIVCSKDDSSFIERIEIQSMIVVYVDGVIGEWLKVI